VDIETLRTWWAAISAGQIALAAATAPVALFLVTWIGKRLSGPKIARVEGDDGGCGICVKIQNWFGRGLRAIDYLATRREWRYRQPWLLVIGERGAGKSSLIASVSASLRHSPPARASELKAKGMTWSYFSRGVLIDADGVLVTGAAGSDEAAQWKRGLADLDALRPERPVDGVILCVSASALRLTGRSSRQVLALEAARQLDQLQTSFDFKLPVYVVVTRCDAIQGFSAFWRNFDVARYADMFGYSAEPNDDELAPSKWAETACDRIDARLRELQVDVAAHREALVDADEFFLFPGHFRSLRDPLGQWLETVFKTSAWKSGHLFRGLYFTGAIESDGTRGDGVRKDVDFVDTLVSEKALREFGLAQPTKRGAWSRNSLIRRLQYLGVGLGLFAFVALAVSTSRLKYQVAETHKGIEELKRVEKRVQAPDSGQCLDAADVYPLLAQVSRIKTDAFYWAIPLSWFDAPMTDQVAEVVGKSTVKNVLMPTIACQLERRAQKLLVSKSKHKKGTEESLAEEQAAFRELVTSARVFEENLERYRALANDNEDLDEAQLVRKLDALSLYVFGQRLPKTAHRRGTVLDDAFRRKLGLAMPAIPNHFHARMAESIRFRSSLLRQSLSKTVASGDDLTGELRDMQQPILIKTRKLGEWMAWVESEWLGSTPERNPCRAIAAANREDMKVLNLFYGEQEDMPAILDKFGESECRVVEMRVLEAMTLAPYGPMFIVSDKGLVLAPEIRRELEGLPALVRLPYMQLRDVAPFVCAGGAVSWRSQEVAEAAGYLEQYRAFAKARTTPKLPDGGEALYERLARYSLALALDDALRRAQRAPRDAAVTAGAAAPSDPMLAEIGGEFARGLGSLKKVLEAYATLDFADNGAAVRQCARDFAADQLGAVDALADASRLYSPPRPAAGEEMYAFGGLPVTRDFLKRQVGRAQVLGSYADPFLTLLADTASVDDAWRDAPQTAAYWHNTRDELSRYTKGKDPAGQVGNLDAYFVGQLTGMTYANCGTVLAAYRSPEFGDDLFSERRRALEAQVKLRCTDRRSADAGQLYADLAARFNRDLAGRYPFAPVTARDANPSTVRAFFLDYAARRASLIEALRGMNGNNWRSANAFLAELDVAAEFFSVNLAAPDDIGAVVMRAEFPEDDPRARGADQIVRWRMSVDLLDSSFPNQLLDLPWYPGESTALELQWAARSNWRPVADPVQPGLVIANTAARFAEEGSWSLLKFIDRHRVPGSGAKPTAPIQLRFVVPVQRIAADGGGQQAQPPETAEAVVFANLRLLGTDPTTRTEKTIVLPVRFPRSAPELE